MIRISRSVLHVIEAVFAVIVLLIALITIAELPRPYPSWPTIGTIPVDPELIIPAMLGIAALGGAIADGFSVGSVVTGLLGFITLWIALTSLHTLYTIETGGVFWGGFFTLLSGGALAVVVLVRGAVRQTTDRGALYRLQNRFGN